MKYVCTICGYVYDETQEGVPFSALPDDWTCPLCGAAKTDFEPLQDAAEAPIAKAEAEFISQAPMETAPDQKLSAGQLSALCSNLARGCEKQYKPDESALFQQLADYFSRITPAVDDATVAAVAQRLKEEVAFYPEAKATAAAASDRGTLRAYTWGEKVTRMLSSLVSRYLTDGEQMLADTEVWLCTVCGFVYIGNEPPKQCPVCKVPSWKFEPIR